MDMMDGNLWFSFDKLIQHFGKVKEAVTTARIIKHIFFNCLGCRIIILNT